MVIRLQALILMTFAVGRLSCDEIASQVLQVHVAEVRQHYCAGKLGPFSREVDRKVISLVLEPRFYYQNIGDDAIILVLGAAASDIYVQTLDGPGVGYTTRIAPLLVPPKMEVPESETQSPPLSRFSILPTGIDRHFLWEYGWVPVFDSSRAKSVDLLGRRIAVRWRLAHSLYSDKQLGELARKWRSFGQLWSETVLTDPVIIDVPLAPEISPCLREFWNKH